MSKPTRYTDYSAIPRRDNYYLAEGWCPNRCGPLSRTGKYEAVCAMCGFEFISKRVEFVFPKDNRGPTS